MSGQPPPRYVLHYALEAMQPQEPIDWIIHELFSAGSVSLLVGEGGTKKTYSLLDAALCVATGKPWLDRPVSQGAVLIIDEESGDRRIKRRISEVMRGHGVDDMTLAWVTLAQFNLTTKADIDEVDKLIVHTGAKLVIIDALADVALGADENAVKDMQPLFMGLRGLAEQYQCAIVLIHHANKAGTYRGSSAIKGAVDALIMVESKRKSPTIEFVVVKGRDVDEFEFAAYAEFAKDTEDNSTFRLHPTKPLDKLEHYSKSESYVLDYLREHGPTTLAVLKDKADRCTPNAARLAVYSLVQRGKVARMDAGGPGDTALYGIVDA